MRPFLLVIALVHIGMAINLMLFPNLIMLVHTSALFPGHAAPAAFAWGSGFLISGLLVFLTLLWPDQPVVARLADGLMCLMSGGYTVAALWMLTIHFNEPIWAVLASGWTLLLVCVAHYRLSQGQLRDTYWRIYEQVRDAEQRGYLVGVAIQLLPTAQPAWLTTALRSVATTLADAFYARTSQHIAHQQTDPLEQSPHQGAASAPSHLAHLPSTTAQSAPDPRRAEKHST